MTGAVEYAEGQIRRLLSGQVELWELPLTGGLWRVTGAQVAQAAAADGAPGAASAVSEEEVRGPHASLAVRLQVCLSP
jgi:DNA polymerase delta subunit 1